MSGIAEDIRKNPIDNIVSEAAINQVKELQAQLQKAAYLQDKLNDSIEKGNLLMIEAAKLRAI